MPFVATPISQRTYSISENIAQLRESATMAVSARARALRAAGRDVLDLGAGEPDFATPEFIRRAAQRAIDAGATRYTATEGILPLREAIAAEANAIYTGIGSVDARDVVVSTGSKQSLFNACFALFGRGDEVLVPTPGWTSYYEMVALARASAVPVFGDPRRDLKISASMLADAATERTRGVILNSPCNPTGALYDRAELAKILALADERDWWVISDEIYRLISYDGVAPSVLEVAHSLDRLVVVNGVAKAFAMTGWRIGWAIAPRAVAIAMTALQSHTTSNAAAVSQHAALAALTHREEAERSIAKMVVSFRARRDAIIAELARVPELRFVNPAGAFYLFVEVTRDKGKVGEEVSGDAGAEFARHLLEVHDVAIVPGSAFLAPEWVRLSYSAPLEQGIEGVRRMIRTYRELAP